MLKGDLTVYLRLTRRRLRAFGALVVLAAGTLASTGSAGAASSYVVQDTFQRANVSSGWGTASNGMSWSGAAGLTTGGSLSVSSDEGLISNSSQYSTFETLGSTTSVDGNGLVRFSVASTADAAGILLRHQSNGSGDLARYDGQGHLQFMVKSGGSWSVVSSTTFSPSSGSFYWLRFELQGSSVYLKVWPSSSTEPSVWTWSGVSSTLTTAGTMGLYGYAQSGAPVSFDSFSVSALGPTAALTMSPASASVGSSVTADASASAPGALPISTYTFDFGDGSAMVTATAPTATATHAYTSGGIYTVTVTVTDTAGNTSQASAQETVGQPHAALSASPLSGTPPLTVTASGSASTDAAGVAITSYTFDFGDGTTTGPQNGASTSHTYTSAGGYTITLTVADVTGATSTTTKSVTVVNGPTASLTLKPAATPAGASITADASASTAGSDQISTYSFSFGDGSAAVLETAPTDSATHTYTTGGIFTVTVTVADTAGYTSQATAQETVGKPVAALTVTPSAGSPPLTVTADASGSTDAAGVPITGYTFNFGDGTILGPQNTATASHTYASLGSYAVTLTVTDGTGATSTASQPVSVVSGPTASISLKPSSTYVGSSVTADASGSSAGTSPISSYTFDFGDGSTLGPQSGAFAAHRYATGGIFSVTVTVTDTAGHSSQASAQETVGQPAAALTVNPSSGAVPLSTTADASGSTDAKGIAITGYTFNFGDGTVAGPQATSTAGHTYSTAGGYTVTVTVTDAAGATSSATAVVTVNNPPVAALAVSPVSGTAPLTVTADASGSSPGSNPIYSYTFNFGDGTAVGPYTSDTATHAYQNAGTFGVSVTVTDSSGLTSTASQTVSVSSPYVVQDTFQRANVSSGWGTASNGMSWSGAAGLTTGGSLSVSSDEGLISNSSQYSTFETLGSTTSVDGNGLVRFSVASTADAAGILLRHQSNGSGDLARYDGQGHLQFMVKSGGSWSVVSSTTFSPSSGSFYWLRFELQGSSVYLKVWPSSSTEPSAWTWSGVSSTLTTAGTMGLYGYAQSGAPVSFDSFAVAPVSPSAPNSVITGTLTDSTTAAGVSGVTVSTIPASTTATTSTSGGYSLPVASGTYTVVFAASGVGYNDNDLIGITAPPNGSVTASQSLIAIPNQIAMDLFTQPNQSGGWSPSTDGNVWSSDLGSPPNGVPATGAGITANQAWVDTSNSTLADVDTWMGYEYTNQEVTANVDATTVIADPHYQHGPRLLARLQTGGTSWNAIVMTIDPPNGSNPVPPGSQQACTGGDISLWVTIPTNWTELAMVCQPVSTGTWYHVRLDVIGNQVQGKVWAFGVTEPAWQISATQTLLTGPGQAGIRTTGSYADWDNFEEAPVTQITGQVTSSASAAPVGGATVSLTNGMSTTTDAGGNYTFSGLPAVLPGAVSYTVTASASGYTSASLTSTPAWGATTTVNLSLT
jgi:PKD repeat protein